MSDDRDIADSGAKPAAENSAAKPKTALKLALAVVFVATVGALYFIFIDELTLENLVTYQTQIDTFKQNYPVLIYGVAFVIYVAVTAFSLPGAAAMTIILGWLLGWRALPLVSFASTTGATCAFLISRYLIRDSIQARFGDHLERFNEALRREGAFYLFTLRLIVGVPFFVINAVMGLTPMRVWTFWWVSQIAMLPGTCVFVYAGASAPDLKQLGEEGVRSVLDLQLVLAFALLGVFPLVVKKIMNVIRARADSGTTSA